MKRSAILIVLAVAACAPQASSPARAEADWASCQTNAFPAARVAACGAVIDNPGQPAERRAQALVERGAARASERQDARAIADFGRALRLDPNNARALSERGWVHQNRQAYDLAVADYEAALRLDPFLHSAAERRDSAIYGRSNAYRDQLRELTALLARDPRNAELLNNRCWLRTINNDDLNLALADCDAALAATPNYAAALDSRGLVHLKRGDFAAALADYDAAVKLEPESGHYVYGRGLARIRLGMKAEGDADLAAGERTQPGVAALYVSYGVGAE